ncbi:MAG: DUF423 domain-containing protein [Bacteroidota bacterium]
MKQTQKIFLSTAAVLGFTGVALGAFGAHGLTSVLSPEALSVFDTAVRYHMYHALSLFVVGILLHFNNQRFLLFAGWSFIVGVILFSGSLYVMTIGNIRGVGVITPLGGIGFLAGWLFLLLSVLKRKMEN